MDRAPELPLCGCVALILFPLWNVEISLICYRDFYEYKMKFLKRVLCDGCGPRQLNLGDARIPLLFL